MSVPMADKYIFCPYCKKSTWVRVTGHDTEPRGLLRITSAAPIWGPKTSHREGRQGAENDSKKEL
jgi:hypothetical protein